MNASQVNADDPRALTRLLDLPDMNVMRMEYDERLDVLVVCLEKEGIGYNTLQCLYDALADPHLPAQRSDYGRPVPRHEKP